MDEQERDKRIGWFRGEQAAKRIGPVDLYYCEACDVWTVALPTERQPKCRCGRVPRLVEQVRACD